MWGIRTKTGLRMTLTGVSLLALAGCGQDGGFDADLRQYGKGIFSTSDAVRSGVADRPLADQRGIISYPGYQVAVARQGDTAASVAARVGLPAQELASYNAIDPNAPLRAGEVLALPRRVPDAPMLAGTAGTGITGTAIPPAGTSSGSIDVTTLASSAIDRSQASGSTPGAAAPAAAPAPTGAEPARHKVERGETAYSIARLYSVNVRALADWNGLGNDLDVREGQILLIPVGAAKGVPAQDIQTLPGEGTPLPPPPSASKPLPEEKTAATEDPVETPPAPDLEASQTKTKLAMPIAGKIIRSYAKGKYDGIDIAATAGAPVTAAGNGTVAAITKNTNGVPILVVRHADNVLTVYMNIDNITVKKGEKVSRGQTIAQVRKADPAFLHFEVRQGMDSVDPMGYLQ